MQKTLNSLNYDRTAIALISASAGELDWVLPILDDLLKKGFNIKIIFLTRHARVSVANNRMLDDYISQQNTQLEVHLCGGYFLEKIERFSYLAHRISIKLKFVKQPIIQATYNLINKTLKKIFMMCLPSEILNLQNEKCLFFSEYPSLRRPRDFWLREDFNKALFFYCPHSPHIYAEDLDKKYSDPPLKDLSCGYFLLLGHPADYSAINDGRELASSDLERVFIGHPKYSNNWLYDYRKKSSIFRSSLSSRSKINILILSRGIGGYLDENEHVNLVETAIETIHNQIANYNLFVKKHPREKNSHWDVVANKHPSITIINDHILNIATSVDFVISFWSSGAMDCHELGVPVIELFDLKKQTKQQFFDEDHYTTIYRKLGLVYPANNEKELANIIARLLRENFDMQSAEPHSFYSDLMNRSNNWKATLGEILAANGFMNS
jgi:hypothetical protein